MTAPTSLAFGADGNLYVADPALGVIRFNGSTGAALGVFVSPGSGGLQDAAKIAFGPDGKLYVGSKRANVTLRFDAATGTIDLSGRRGTVTVEARF